MVSAVVTFAGANAVRPGEPSVVVVTVTNVGSTVEAYDVAVLGELAAFATVAPPTLRLLPGQQEAATVTLVVGSEIPAGPVPFGVKVHPHSAGGEAVVEERELQVLPVADITIRAVPMVLRTRRRGEARVEVENTGNTPVNVALAVTDPNEELSAALRPPELAVAPRAVGTAGLTLRSLAPRGASIGYTISAQTPDGQVRQVEARIETTRRRVAPWVAVAAVVALGAVVAAGQLGTDEAKVNVFSSVNTATPLSDPPTSSPTAPSVSSDPASTTSLGEVTNTSAAPGGTTVEPPGSPAPPPPAASSTTTSGSLPKPPEPTPKPTTTLPPPCSPSPCANVARNSTGTILLDTRKAERDPYGGWVVITGVTQPSRGTAWISDGGYVVRYTPTRDYTGRDQVTVNLSDSRAEGTNSSPVYITVY